MAPSITYLRHQIDAEGLHPLPEKTRSILIREAPTPKNVTELKSYLGLLNYWKIPPKPGHHVWHHCISCYARTLCGTGH